MGCSVDFEEKKKKRSRHSSCSPPPQSAPASPLSYPRSTPPSPGRVKRANSFRSCHGQDRRKPWPPLHSPVSARKPASPPQRGRGSRGRGLGLGLGRLFPRLRPNPNLRSGDWVHRNPALPASASGSEPWRWQIQALSTPWCSLMSALAAR